MQNHPSQTNVFEPPLLADRYLVKEWIGEGFHVDLFRVFDTIEQKTVALKKLHSSFSFQDLHSHFQDQFSVLQKIKNIHLVEFLGIAQDSTEGSFFVLEWFESLSIASLLQEKALKKELFSVDETLAILQQIARGLECLHLHGILHLDLNPTNIWIADYQVKVADFGVSQFGSGSQTSQKDLVCYWSPEQSNGSHKLAPSSDLYSLSVIAFEMLTGKKYRTGMPGPSRFNSECNLFVDSFFRKALNWDPDSRFSHVSSWLNAFEEALTSLPDYTNSILHRIPRIRRIQLQDSQQTAVRPSMDPDEAIQTEQSHSPFWQSPKRPNWLLPLLSENMPKLLSIQELSHQDKALLNLEAWQEGHLLLSKKEIPLLVLQTISQGNYRLGIPQQEKAENNFFPVKMDTFAISEQPVSSFAWAVFLEESGYSALPAKVSSKTEFVHSISLADAWAFCDFYDLSLPSEAQWEIGVQNHPHVFVSSLLEWVADEYIDDYETWARQEKNPCNQGHTLSSLYALRGGSPSSPFLRDKMKATVASEVVGFRVVFDFISSAFPKKTGQ